MAIQSLTSVLSATALAAQVSPTSRQSGPSDGASVPAALVSPIVAQSTQSAADSQGAAKTEITNAVTKVQKAIEPIASNLVFSIDEDSGRTVVKVIDSSTKETIRQIPSEEVLEIARALDKLQGLLLRQTA